MSYGRVVYARITIDPFDPVAKRDLTLRLIALLRLRDYATPAARRRALAHALCYGLPFLLLCDWQRGWHAAVQWWAIVGTHAVVDRYGLARYVVWAKNFLAPRWLDEAVFTSWLGQGFMKFPTGRRVRNYAWSECSATGYPPDRPDFLAVWLLIIADNILHVLINGAALRWL
jgi:hypothetical protein